MNSPIALKEPKKIIQHGFTRVDNYSWLRDENWKKFIKGDLDFSNGEVKKHLSQEAEFTKEKMKGTDELQKTIYDELVARTKEDDESFPFKKNNYFYYQRTEKEKNYPILCRKKDTLESDESIYFDVNKQAVGHNLYSHRGGATNDSNSLYAFAYNLTGSMDSTIKLRDLTTNKDFPWEIPNCGGSFWWHDDSTILFIELDEFSRGKKLFSMNVFDGPSSKKLLFEKPEKYTGRFMSMSRSKNKELCIIYLSSGSSSALYLKTKNESSFSFFQETKDNIDYQFEYKNNDLFILTNDFNNPNFALFKTSLGKISSPDSWDTIIPNSENIYLQNMTIYGQKMVLTTKNNSAALDELVLLDLSDHSKKVVTMDNEVYYFSLMGAHDPESTTIRFMFQSQKQPLQDRELCLLSGEQKVLKTKTVLNFNPDDYEVKREFATAHDGKKIPLSILYKKELPSGTPRRVYLYAYGSYGMGMPAYFSANILSLCERGFSFVIAHIRGGDDKGFDWYLDGKMKNKLNTFKDYISSCEHLIKNEYVKKGEIVASGGSAGGLLMGAVANMRPDLFKCIIADVAFVDVINTISDETLPLTPPEWEEWGNPITNKDDYEYMMQYSPYDNIEKKNYPAMLYNSGISDEQVTYWEPAKMVAKLREHKTDDNLLLLNIKMHAGHAGASARYEDFKDRAFDFAFILNSFQKVPG